MDMKTHDTVQRMMSNIARSVKRIELGAYAGPIGREYGNLNFSIENLEKFLSHEGEKNVNA